MESLSECYVVHFVSETRILYHVSETEVNSRIEKHLFFDIRDISAVASVGIFVRELFTVFVIMGGFVY